MRDRKTNPAQRSGLNLRRSDSICIQRSKSGRPGLAEQKGQIGEIFSCLFSRDSWMLSTDLKSTAGMHFRAIWRYEPGRDEKDAVNPGITSADGDYGGSRCHFRRETGWHSRREQGPSGP